MFLLFVILICDSYFFAASLKRYFTSHHTKTNNKRGTNCQITVCTPSNISLQVVLILKKTHHQRENGFFIRKEL